MLVQLKKVIIIFIVCFITFASITSALYKQTQNTIPHISVVSSEEISSAYKPSFAQNIFNELSINMYHKNDFEQYGTSIYQISNGASTQFENIVNSSDMIVVIGDVFNKFLMEYMELYEEKQFVLIENSNDYNYQNVYQINIDYQEIYNKINRISNEHSKSLVVVSNEFSNLAQSTYYNNEITTNLNVKLEVVSDTTDDLQLKNNLIDYFNDGYTTIYSFDPYNNDTINETVDEYNRSLVEEVSEEKNEEVSEDASKEVSKQINEQVKSYYLNLTELSENDNQSGVLTYNVEKQLIETVESLLADRLLSGKIEVSIINNIN